jgi:hypothetical protein
VQLGTVFYGKPRLYRLSGAPPSAAVCGNGLAADGVYVGEWTAFDTNGNPFAVPQTLSCPAIRGTPFRAEAGGNISAGQNLQSDASGRVVAFSSGAVVARALEGDASGSLIWCVFA